MSTREYIGAPGEFTGGFKNKLLRHRMERTDGSTLLLLDFGVAESNPYADGTLTVGNTFTPIVGPTATVVGTSATAKLIKSGGKIIAPASSTGSTIQGINIGSPGAFNLTAENPDFHVMMVFTVPNDAGDSSLNYKSFLTLGGQSDNAFNFDTGVNGRSPRGGLLQVAGAPAQRSVTGLVKGAANPVSLTRVGTTSALWLNGSQISTWTNGAALPDLSATQMQLLNNHSGQSVWAMLFERIPAGRTAEQAVGDAYAAAVKIGYA